MPAAVLGIGLALCVPVGSAKQATKDPKAMAALDRMVAYLQSLPAFGVQASITRDEVVGDGFKLQRSTSAKLSVKRPDRLRAELDGNHGERVLVYDGKQLSVLAKDENYYGSIDAPPTLLETLDVAAREYGLDLPLVDMIYVAMGGDLGAGVELAGHIGAASVYGEDCTQVAFRTAKADFQLWIGTGKQAVPRKLVVTTRDDPTQPQYEAVMQWDTAPKFAADTFTFKPPEGVRLMALVPADLGGSKKKKTKK